MPGSRHQTRRRAISVTSLIDVIFLLLLFFMLTSTFSRFGELTLSPVSAGSVTASDLPPLILQLGPDRLVLNGRTVALDDMSTAIEGLDASALLVTLQEGTTSQRLVDVLTRLPGGERALPVRILE